MYFKHIFCAPKYPPPNIKWSRYRAHTYTCMFHYADRNLLFKNFTAAPPPRRPSGARARQAVEGRSAKVGFLSLSLARPLPCTICIIHNTKPKSPLSLSRRVPRKRGAGANLVYLYARGVPLLFWAIADFRIPLSERTPKRPTQFTARVMKIDA